VNLAFGLLDSSVQAASWD